MTNLMQEGDIVVDYAGEMSVALMLPWADASGRQYTKIVQFYRNLGLATVVHNCPTTSTSEARAGNAAMLLGVLEKLVDGGVQHIFTSWFMQ